MLFVVAVTAGVFVAAVVAVFRGVVGVVCCCLVLSLRCGCVVVVVVVVVVVLVGWLVGCLAG